MFAATIKLTSAGHAVAVGRLATGRCKHILS
jgi:hypothetical protein